VAVVVNYVVVLCYTMHKEIVVFLRRCDRSICMYALGNIGFQLTCMQSIYAGHFLVCVHNVTKLALCITITGARQLPIRVHCVAYLCTECTCAVYPSVHELCTDCACAVYRVYMSCVPTVHALCTECT
jgi:hypothetical protein